MIIVPMHNEAPPPTRRSRELQGRLEGAIRDFRRENSGLTDNEVRAALAALAPAGDDSAAQARRRVAAVAIVAVAVALAGAVLASSRGGDDEAARVAMPIVAAVAAAVAVAVAAFKFRSRD